MRIFRCDLSQELTQIDILPLSDIHKGDENCDIKLVKERIDYIHNNPNVYTILNGDLMDMAIASSIGDTHKATLQPMEQLKAGIDLFGKIKDKTLCITSGNHEERINKNAGIDIARVLAMQLGLEDIYTDTAGLLFMRFGKQPTRNHSRPMRYTIYVNHGSGGGRKEGGKINRLVDYSSIVDADIYICSHTHMPAILKTGYYRIDTNNSTATMVDKLFVNTAGHLKYGGYGSRQGYKPASTDTPIIHMDGLRKQMTATL